MQHSTLWHQTTFSTSVDPSTHHGVFAAHLKALDRVRTESIALVWLLLVFQVSGWGRGPHEAKRVTRFYRDDKGGDLLIAIVWFDKYS